MACSSIKGLKKPLFCLGESILLFSTTNATVFYHWAWMNLEIPQLPAPGSRSVHCCLLSVRGMQHPVPISGLLPQETDRDPAPLPGYPNSQLASLCPRTVNWGYLSSTSCPSTPATHLCRQPPHLRNLRMLQASLDCESWFIFIGKYQTKVAHS